MSMPNMTGIQLADNLFSIRRDIPIVICTGFSEKTSEEKAKAKGINGFLMKPVVRSELAKMVRKVLDKVPIYQSEA
jgi:CheY-like chemotaxis protein